ncbi:guanine nucleotide exchange factor DBS-like [Gracilinanus agilis]|uniref:guanine nucleotide exchange factor DBS-like n=1 Tax=Gracilinanus agilis TaxID=191870 RepID=UPI001CFE44C1|nr:guanine nucleotide exchange factor DBS-like [Gracilinanus agilis]
MLCWVLVTCGNHPSEAKLENADKVIQKLEDVQEMFDRRQVSLKKLAAKQTRPVQPVAPHPESSPKRASPKASRPPTLAPSRRISEVPCPPKSVNEAELLKKKSIKKPKGGIKIEVMHEASQGGSSRILVMSESEENLSTRRSHIMHELIETERVYVEELQSIIEGYAAEMDNPDLNHLIPVTLQNKKEILFGNLHEIYEFHKSPSSRELSVAAMLYHQLTSSCRSTSNHRSVSDGLLSDLVLAILHSLLKELTHGLTKAWRALLHLSKEKGFETVPRFHEWAEKPICIPPGDLHELGKLLMQGSFSVWTDHKKGHNKVKDLARFKPMQRHLFLYAKLLLFCKKREDSVDGHEKSPSYSFKNSLKMSMVGITENVKGDNKKFEIWYNGREEVYIIQASSVELKNLWVSEIRKVLTGQLEACREASQLHQRITESVYHAPMDTSNSSRYSRKSASIYENKPESSGLENSTSKNPNPSPNSNRQKRDPEAKEKDVTRRFSLASSLGTTAPTPTGLTKGPPGPAVKVKRHEIKSDPTPLGFEGTCMDMLHEPPPPRLGHVPSLLASQSEEGLGRLVGAWEPPVVSVPK